MRQIINEIVDPEIKGEQKEFKYSVEASDAGEAKEIFLNCSNRLKDINNWHKVAGGISAQFWLTDETGREIVSEPAIGNFIKIDIPGPGTLAGKGYDWVRIEEVVYKEEGDERLSLIKVRPSENPDQAEKGTAHFLSSQSSSTFLIFQKGTKVTSEIYGRNELPNLEGGSIIDKTRNLGVATGAILGIANIQWNLLAQGLLK